MDRLVLTSDMTIAGLLARWPATSSVFRRFAVACIGCGLDTFCTLSDAAGEFDLPIKMFVDDLKVAIDGSPEIKRNVS